MSEKFEMQSYAESILNQRDIEFLHIPNSTFKGGKKRSSKLKDQPDLLFTFRDKMYLREFGVKGSHLDRKERQAQKMLKWQKQAPAITDIRLIWSRAELEEDFKKIGLLT